MSEYVSSVLLKQDNVDNDFIHVYYPGKVRHHYLYTLHFDNMWDLFGEHNYSELKELLKQGNVVPFTISLTLQSYPTPATQPGFRRIR